MADSTHHKLIKNRIHSYRDITYIYCSFNISKFNFSKNDKSNFVVQCSVSNNYYHSGHTFPGRVMDAGFQES